jgi:hypothetical protein
MSDADRVARIAAGIAITDKLIDVCAPIVDGQETALVTEALAAAFMAMLVAGTPNKRDQFVVLARYAERILEYARDA